MVPIYCQLKYQFGKELKKIATGTPQDWIREGGWVAKGESTVDSHNYPDMKVAGTSTRKRVESTQIHWIFVGWLTGH